MIDKLLTKVTLPRILVAFFHGLAIIPLWKIVGSISRSSEYLDGFTNFISLQLSVDYLTAKIYSIPFGLLYIIGGYLVLKSKEIKIQWIGALLYLLFFSSFWLLAFSSKIIYKDEDGFYECYNRSGNHPFLPETKLRKPTLEEGMQIKKAIQGSDFSIFRCCKKKRESQFDKIFENG